MALTAEEIRESLKKVDDPEIHMNVVDLGLIYGVDMEPQDNDKFKVNVRATLTSPGCPYGPQMLSAMHAQVAQFPEVSEVNIDLVWIPQWDPRKMASDEAKMRMGIFDMEDDEEGETPQ